MKKKKTILIISLVLSIAFSINSCNRKKRVPEPAIIGTVTVDLDANQNVVRKKETLIGNMISDALKEDFENKNKPVDFAFVNSGIIRYSSSKRASGIYKAGDFSADMADEMLPFGDVTVITKVNGKQLKEVFERSVASYPLAKGNFLQVSKEIQVLVDTTRSPQVLNIENTAIVTPGKRIISIKINNIEIDSLKEYTVGMPNFIAEGNDGYVTFKNLSPSLKESIGEDVANLLKEYIIINSPVTPKFEGRIKYQ
ncbi:MAG: 5'-nucleotidase [Bacteroidota bacterium]